MKIVTKIGQSIALLIIVPVVLVIAVPVLMIVAPLIFLYRCWLRINWELKWGRNGKRILLVYSRSPNWQEYIETNWVPKLRDVAVILDWSDRSVWPMPTPIEVRVFRHWGGKAEFNPLAIVFPLVGKVRVIRFWQPFKDYKHGKNDALRKAEEELFRLAN